MNVPKKELVSVRIPEELNKKLTEHVTPLGISKNALMYNKTKQSRKYRLLSILVPIYLHLVYDLFLVKKNFIMYSIFIVYIIVIYIMAYQRIKRLSSIHKNLSQKEKDIS